MRAQTHERGRTRPVVQEQRRELMETKSKNEAELITRILAGEKELFHELIRPYERMTYLTVFFGGEERGRRGGRGAGCGN